MKTSDAEELFAALEDRGWTVNGLTARTTDLSIQDYHSLPGYGSTLIRAGDRSGLHLLQARNETKTSAAMDLGTAFHSAYLEPGKFKSRYIFAEYRDQRTSEFKRWAKQQDATKEILHFDMSETIQGMLDSANTNKLATSLMSNGIVEESTFWLDEKTGVLCKSRTDYVSSGLGEQIVDIKTCKDASFDTFQRTVVTMGYHIQAAIQMEAVRVTRGDLSDHPHKSKVISDDVGTKLVGTDGHEITNRRVHSLFAIENVPPYGNALYPLDDELICIGHSRFRFILTQIADWENSGVWPGYPPMLDMYAPVWMK